MNELTGCKVSGLTSPTAEISQEEARIQPDTSQNECQASALERAERKHLRGEDLWKVTVHQIQANQSKLATSVCLLLVALHQSQLPKPVWSETRLTGQRIQGYFKVNF